jgi:hypothetical protein
VIEAPERVQNHAHAVRTLSDTSYLVYVLIQMFKFATALLTKRWPELG